MSRKTRAMLSSDEKRRASTEGTAAGRPLGAMSKFSERVCNC